MHKQIGLELVEFECVLQLLEEAKSSGFGGEITDVRSEDRAALSCDGEGSLLMSAEGDDGFGGGEWQWQWGEATCESEHGCVSADHAYDTVINGSEDRAFVSEEEIGAVLELLNNIGVCEEYGVIFEVSA
jgi:hypothetical protein